VPLPPAGAALLPSTGDARLTVEATQQQPALQAVVGKAVLVLDTTYADPAYCFPSQQQVLDWCLQAVKVRLTPISAGNAYNVADCCLPFQRAAFHTGMMPLSCRQ
jgi:hypothetical protein